MKVPLLGCNSHRLNLAMNALYATSKSHIDKVNDVMIDLRSLKNASKLRKKTTLHPERRNVTRWSSTHSMLLKYLKFAPYLNECGFEDSTLDKLLSQSELRKIERICEDSDKFYQVSKVLQKDDSINLYIVRELFNGTFIISFLVTMQH